MAVKVRPHDLPLAVDAERKRHGSWNVKYGQCPPVPKKAMRRNAVAVVADDFATRVNAARHSSTCARDIDRGERPFTPQESVRWRTWTVVLTHDVPARVDAVRDCRESPREIERREPVLLKDETVVSLTGIEVTADEIATRVDTEDRRRHSTRHVDGRERAFVRVRGCCRRGDSQPDRDRQEHMPTVPSHDDLLG